MNSELEDLTLEEVFNKFIAEKKAINLAEETIETYESVFNNFKQVYSSEKLCSGITHNTINEFINYFQERNAKIKAVSINTQLRHLRAILYYAMNMGYLQNFSIKMMNYQKEEKDIYSEAEQRRLTAAPNKKCNFAEFRNWAMVCYFLGTGNRLNTVRNLKIGDIDFDNDEIVLKKVKNNKSYRIPLSPLLKEILQEYLKHRKGQLDDYLFPNQYGGPMTRNTITTAIYRYNHSRGVMKTSTHLFRHTYATNYINNGGNVLKLQKLLGHSSMAMVKEYVSLSSKDLAKDYDKLNPLESLRENVLGRKAIKMN